MQKAKKIREAVIHVDRESVKKLGGVIPGDIRFPTGVSDKQVKNINKALGTRLGVQEMVVVMDLTVFGSCKEAIVFTREGVYATSIYLSENVSKKGKLPMPLRYDQLVRLSVATEHDVKGADPKRYMVLRLTDGRRITVYMGGYAVFMVMTLRGILDALKEEETAEKKTQNTTAEPVKVQEQLKQEPPKQEPPTKPAEEPEQRKSSFDAAAAVEEFKQSQGSVQEEKSQDMDFDLDAALETFKASFVLPGPQEKPASQPEQPPAPKKTGVDPSVLLERGMAAYEEKNYKEAFPRILAAAEAELPEAWFYLAQMYYHGWGTEENRPRALVWYVKANEHREDLRCLHPIAQMLKDLGVYESALKYAKRAYALNPEGNKRLMGQIYEGWAEEHIGKKQMSAALDMFRKAGDYGDSTGAYNAAIMYDTGEGTAADPGAAFEWFRKAAELGEKKAYTILGTRCYNGEGTAQSEDEALRWFEQGAKRGEPGSAYNVAVIYYNRHSYYKAMDYARTAKKLGAEGAEDLISKIRKHI